MRSLKAKRRREKKLEKKLGVSPGAVSYFEIKQMKRSWQSTMTELGRKKSDRKSMALRSQEKLAPE